MSTPTAEAVEPTWVHGQDDGETVGVCLSGGGLRAASFALGVLQVLQEERHLLYGSQPASYLAAVSGGSYIAAAHVLGGCQRSSSPETYNLTAPMSLGSPEEEHVLSHGRYLVNPVRMVLFSLINLAALGVLFAWAGVIVADVASLWPQLPVEVEAVLVDLSAPSAALHMALMFGSLWLLVRALYSGSRRIRVGLGLVGALLLLVSSRPVLAEATQWSVFDSFEAVMRAAGLLLIVLAMLIGLGKAMKAAGVLGLPATVVNIGAGVVVRVVGSILLLFVAVAWFPVLAPALADGYAGSDDDFAIFGLFMATLAAGVFFSFVPHRASLHREYRSKLQSCFSVARSPHGGLTHVGHIPLSAVKPPSSGPDTFPRLVVCATANVRVKRGDRRWTFVPFLMSHDYCGTPGHPETWLPTTSLERREEPAGLLPARGKESLVSLFTAVAATGAAVSPSMGRMTVPSARPVIAALNIRLGRWFPNPFDERARAAVLAEGKPKRIGDVGLGPGYDELVPEMVGLTGPRAYISDGGHYDNLGLLALLRAGCTEIWCVDASPDPKGLAKELERVLAIAEEELKIPVEIDLQGFRRRADGLYAATHAVGRIHYGSSDGRLVVVKLGLTSESSASLRNRKRRFGFPHHPTWRQIYNRDRMTVYRDVGRENAKRCLADP